MTDQSPIAQFDEAKAQAFAERFVGTLNEAALAGMTSLGHRSGLLGDCRKSRADLCRACREDRRERALPARMAGRDGHLRRRGL